MADNGLFGKVYNPDVLSCLANLSNDEVFTPPEIVNEMLDMLPQELFENPDTTFLDPACKSGVFLREIAKRLLVGLEPQFPDLQDRVDHIFQKQLFGIAITELTSLLSRRSVYCSKYPNSHYSVTLFDDAEGNIRFKRVQHTWVDNKCKYCGAAKSQYDRDDGLETHAYEWIHTVKPEEIFNMKFDVIIANPPYQLSTGGGDENSAKQAKPIYHLFVEQAKKLNPKYITMIIPARWFSGGMGLDAFRKTMINDYRIQRIVDYPNAKDCFPQNSISGGICYFLWDRDAGEDNNCVFTNKAASYENTMTRPLNEFDVLVRYNRAISIIRKVKLLDGTYLDDVTSSISPFGISTKVRGENSHSSSKDVRLYTSSGKSYVFPTTQIKKSPYFDCFKVMVSQTSAEHAGEPGKDGRYRVLTTSMQVLKPTDVCSHSYILVGKYLTQNEAENALTYLQTKFVRFLLLQKLTSIHISKATFGFVPTQDFSKPWTDEELYAKYGLTQEEIDFIDLMIKPMDLGDDS